jgi:hypothetical protein
MIGFIAGVMDWLERRHCAVCSQYIGDDRECQNAVCVCSGCGERKGPYNFAEAERCNLVLPGRAGPCERCLKAYEGHQINEKLHPE